MNWGRGGVGCRVCVRTWRAKHQAPSTATALPKRSALEVQLRDQDPQRRPLHHEHRPEHEVDLRDEPVDGRELAAQGRRLLSPALSRRIHRRRSVQHHGAMLHHPRRQPSFLRRQERRVEGRRCECGLVRSSRRPTPHLASPLKGGRDELGERGTGVGRVGGSCLRRNDGRGGAGMTDGGVRRRGG